MGYKLFWHLASDVWHLRIVGACCTRPYLKPMAEGQKGKCFDLLFLILVLQLSNQTEGANEAKKAQGPMSKNLAISQED